MPRRASLTPGCPSVLIVCDVVPGHRASGAVRLANMAVLWAECSEVALFALDPHLDEPDHHQVRVLRSAGVDVFELYGPTALRATLATRVFDLVLVEFWYVAERVLPVIRTMQPWATVVVDSVDLHFVREERGAALGRVPPAGLEDRRRRELAAYQAADVRIFVSADERRRYRELVHSEAGDVVVSNVVLPVTRSSRQRRPIVAFVANFWHEPNVDGLAWFVKEVWPTVLSLHPTATFAVAGSHVGEEIERIGRSEGVEVRGFVDDLHAFYDEAAVAVAPLRFGAGVKGKVTGALGAGVPLVATGLATEGLDLEDGVDLAVADGAAAFADRLHRLLDDPAAAESLGVHGRRSILAQCGADAARISLLALSEQAVAASVRPGPLWRLKGVPVLVWHRARPAARLVVRARNRLARRFCS